MRLLITLLLTLLGLNCSNKKTLMDPNDFPLTAEQAALVQKNMQLFPVHTQFSIALITNGAVTYTGVLKTRDSIKTVNNHQKNFEIGSISKVFTATLLANLIEDGTLKPDDLIRDHLDIPWNTSEKINFQNLSNHTSGLPILPSNLLLDQVDPGNPYKDYGVRALETYLKEEMKVQQTPGTKYEYSNLGAGLLGYIMTQVTKTSYDDLLQQYICGKYGMSQTTTLKAKVEEYLVKGLDPKGKDTPNWDLNVLVGAGGIKSTVEDLVKFAKAHFDQMDPAMQLTQQATFTINRTTNIGLGWHLIKEENGREMIWHHGGTGGYTSFMVLDIKQKDGVILLSNISGFHPKMTNLDALGFGLMQTL